MFGDWKLNEVPAWNLLSQSLWIGYRPIPASSPRIPPGDCFAGRYRQRLPKDDSQSLNSCKRNGGNLSPTGLTDHAQHLITLHTTRSPLRIPLWKTLPVSKAGDFWSTHIDVHVMGAERNLLASVGKTRRKRMSEICILRKRVSDVTAEEQFSLTLRQQARRSARLPDSGLRRDAGHY